MSQDFQIYTHNYTLNPKQEKVIQDTMDSLSQKVPCHSIIHIDLEYQNNAFGGKLKIITNKKVFFSQDLAKTIPQLFKGLNKKTTKQVMKWKKSRTKQDITGIIDLNELRNQKELFKKVG